MRTDYSTPGVTPQSSRSAIPRLQDKSDEEKQVYYSHLDIIAETERIIERRLIRHTRTSGKYHCACPFPDCTSKQDAFTVWDRPVLEERGNGRREVHFWCGRCGRTGSLISLIRQYREATTGEQVSWADAAHELRIDPRTWRARDDNDQTGHREQRQATATEKRRQQTEQQRKVEQTELATLDALYHRARAWLTAGQITMKDGRKIALNQARAYLLARGYTLDQAAQLGLAYIPTVQEVPELADLVARTWRGRILFPLTGPCGARGYAGRTLWHWMPNMTAEQHKQLLDTWNEQHPGQRVARHYKTHQPAYYGYEDACRVSILVIVEGEFDAASVRLALTGLPDVAVCAFGKNFQARLVPMNILHVVLALDIDQAGQSATEKLANALQVRGVTVGVAIPPSGKDWNDCHLLVGLEAIGAEIVRACTSSLTVVSAPEQNMLITQDFQPRPIEPPGYENGDVCLMCGMPVEAIEGAFYVCEDKASFFYGDTFCTLCWSRQSLPKNCEQSSAAIEPAPEIRDQDELSDQSRDAFLALVHRVFANWKGTYTIAEEDQGDLGERAYDDSDQNGQFTEVNHRCSKHHRPLRYGDELGGRYCNHVDCWERYRLMRRGAERGYPALSSMVDPRDYLPDTNKAPLYYTASGLPVYPARLTIFQQLIVAGADSWHDYATRRDYHDIDKAIKATTREMAVNDKKAREMNQGEHNHA